MTTTGPSAAKLYGDIDFFDLLVGSYLRTVGKPLISPNHDLKWLYNDAPFAVVAHNTTADPIFVYANTAAQRCFEYGWDEFTTLPSRLSAELPNRTNRQHLLERVARDGFASRYRGERIAKSGRRFWIDSGVIWQLAGPDGEPRGQAATFGCPSEVRKHANPILALSRGGTI
jgi:hypothetical protein